MTTRTFVRRAVLAGALTTTIAVLAACGSAGDQDGMHGMPSGNTARATSVGSVADGLVDGLGQVHADDDRRHEHDRWYGHGPHAIRRAGVTTV